MSRTLRAIAAAALMVAGLLAGAPTAASAATRPAPADSAVRVASYNILHVTSGTGKKSWAHRRKALVRTVRAASPDVLLVQEANTQKWKGTRHIDDVRALLAPLGYRIANTGFTCTPGCTRGAHVFFKTSRMALSDVPDGPSAGMEGMSVIADTDFGSIQDRAVSWAFLTPRGGGRPALYISVHLPTQKTVDGERLRQAVASHLKGWADSLIRRSGLSRAAIVIGGDFNSYAKRQPEGAQKVLAADGLIDAFQAPVRVNEHYGTVNVTPATAKYKGFPPRPWYYRNEPTRIDYIFATVQPLRHEVVLRLTKSGRFNNNYRASDHNMVMADLKLR